MIKRLLLLTATTAGLAALSDLLRKWSEPPVQTPPHLRTLGLPNYVGPDDPVILRSVSPDHICIPRLGEDPNNCATHDHIRGGTR